MDSLRRLTSSVFDGGGGNTTITTSSGVGIGPRVGSSGFSAFLPAVGLALGGGGAGDPLELTYVTEQLVVCGFPVTTPTSRKMNTANVDELARVLETRHGGHYLVFNLNALDEQPPAANGSCASPAAAPSPSLIEQLWKKTPHTSTATPACSPPPHATPPDARAIAGKLREQMLEFSWERDGMKAHTPPFDLVFRICYSIFAWLSLDARNVAVVHCQSGKTRSGVVVACYLLFARLADDPIDAFVEFYRKRWDMRSLTPQALRSKTPPSIQRFLASFHELVEYQKPPNDKPMLLKAIIFRALPVELRPCVQIWDDYRMVFCTDSQLGAASKDPPVLDWSGDDGFLAILWENGIELDGGFSILCSFGDEYDTSGDDVDASSRVLFRYADSTWFLSPGLVTLTKSKLDMMKQYEHGFDDEQFSVDLVMHENSSVKKAARKNHVRLDYTGNNAVRQGMIEITKHHMVLPDPAMHSNFIRMGFGETPTTFALQRSQNAPNVALDLLHSEGLSACFSKESPGKQSQNAAATAAAGSSFLPGDLSTQMPAGEPTMHPPNTALRRQTTAEIVAMQSQRSRYSIPTAVDSSICQVCKDDDYMMRPQIVQCTGKCGSFYHTTCVGLRKIPFGLTTLSDRTNHSVYVKKFFRAWECDTCAPPPTSPSTVFRQSATAIEVPPGMALVPSAWASNYVPSATSHVPAAAGDSTDPGGIKDTLANGQSTAPISFPAQIASTTPASTSLFPVSVKHLVEASRDESANQQESESAKLDRLRNFLLSSGVSVEDLLRAATTSNVAIAPTPPKDRVHNTHADVPEVKLPFAAASSSSLAVQTALHGIGEWGANEPKSPMQETTSSKTQPPARSPSKQVELQPPSPHTRVDQHLESSIATESSHVGPSIQNSTSKSAPTANSTIPTSSETASKTAVVPTALIATKPQALDMKSALLQDIVAKKNKGSAEADPATPAADPSPMDSAQCSNASKYDMMLKRGVPFEAVQNCMVKDGIDPSTLQRLQQASKMDVQPSEVPPADVRKRLKDVEEFKSYFCMLRLGCPKEAVKHKLIMDGLDPIIVDLGPEAIYDDVKDKITIVLPAEDRSRLQDDIKCVREPKSKRSTASTEHSQRDGKTTEPTGEQETTGSCTTDGVLLRDHELYAKYFKMLKMGLPVDAVRHKMRAEGADERALEIGGDAPYSKLAEAASSPATATLGDDPVYSKYFKMLKMGLPEGAVRHKMVTDGIDVKALDLGPDALVTDLTNKSGGGSTNAANKPGSLQAPKAKQRRKKLHWQAISEDRLSNLNQHTIWEDRGDDEVDFDMDMDELESLFFANSDASLSSGSGKRKNSQGKALKRKQSVTLVDGKRAMNAAISLARVRLSYSAIAEAVQSFDAMGLSLQQLIGINEFLPTPEEVAIVTAYTGDIALLGEAEKFFLEIAKVKRYASRMECLVFKVAFPARSAELRASYSNMIKACEEVKGSRLLKILLSMVLKLGNTLNGSGDDNGIRGFTVDSLLRLGHTKAVNQKTTVLHYLVRLVKKNHPQVLDFQEELKSVPLAARESFETIADDFAKLQTGYAKLTAELDFHRTNDGSHSTAAAAMQAAAAVIDVELQKLDEEIKRGREEVNSVFGYFGEDPSKSPTDFFATLTSFCTAFEAARKEVDAMDEAALRAERLKLRRAGSVTARLASPDDTASSATSAFRLRERSRSTRELPSPPPTESN